MRPKEFKHDENLNKEQTKEGVISTDLNPAKTEYSEILERF